MIPENPGREELADWAALYVAGALDAVEHAEFTRRLESDAALRAEIERMRPVAEALARSAPAVPPRPELHARVLARVRAERAAAPEPRDPARPWRSWVGDVGTSAYVPASEEGFERTAFEGVSVRRLHVDRARDRVTMLVRMQAGSRYPAHRHGGPEECYVISGDLSVGEGLRMKSGDYQRVERSSVHPVQATERGCLLLIVSSMQDELLGGAA